MQHLGPFSTDRDGDTAAYSRGGPAYPLRPVLIRSHPVVQEVTHTGHVILNTCPRGGLIANVEHRTSAAGDIHEGSPVGKTVNGGKKRRHHLRLTGERVGRPWPNACPHRGHGHERSADKGVATNKGGVDRANSFGTIR